MLVWPWNRQAALHVKLETANVSSSTMTEMSNYSFKAIEGRIKILDNLDLHKPWLVNHYEDTLVSWTNPSQSHRDKSQNNWILLWLHTSRVLVKLVTVQNDFEFFPLTLGINCLKPVNEKHLWSHQMTLLVYSSWIIIMQHLHL